MLFLVIRVLIITSSVCIADSNSLAKSATQPVLYKPTPEGNLRGESTATQAGLSAGGYTVINIAPFEAPQDIKVDSIGDVYVLDKGPTIVFKIKPGGAPPTQVTQAGDLTTPVGISVDTIGDVYISDLGAAKIYKVPSGGTATPVISGVTGLDYYYGLAVDSLGYVYVLKPASLGQYSLNKYPPESSTPTTFSTNTFSLPSSVVVDSSGYSYVTDSDHVVKVAPDGTQTLIPVGYSPNKVAVDSLGDMYVIDHDGSTGYVYMYTPGGTKTTVVTSSSFFKGLAVNSVGAIYVSDDSFLYAVVPPPTTTPVSSPSSCQDGKEKEKCPKATKAKGTKAPETGYGKEKGKQEGTKAPRPSKAPKPLKSSSKLTKSPKATKSPIGEKTKA